MALKHKTINKEYYKYFCNISTSLYCEWKSSMLLIKYSYGSELPIIYFPKYDIVLE